VLKLYAMTFEFAFRLLFGSKSWAGARLPGFGVDFSYETLGKLQPELESGTGIEAHHMPGRLVGDVPDEDAIPVHFKMPIASLMEPGSEGFATLMEPADRQGHGATPQGGMRRIASLMEPPDRQGHGATSRAPVG
jgi:hypothetical protein